MAVRIRLATPRMGRPWPRSIGLSLPGRRFPSRRRVPDREEMARRIDETLRSYPWLVCDVDGQTAGYAYATRHRVRGAYQWSVDTSVYIAEDHRRRNIGRGLYTSLFAILAAQGYFNAFAGIALPNPASVALHESMGFEPIGVYRRVGYKFDQLARRRLVAIQPQAAAARPVRLSTSRRFLSQPGWTELLTRGESIIRAKAA